MQPGLGERLGGQLPGPFRLLRRDRQRQVSGPRRPDGVPPAPGPELRPGLGQLVGGLLAPVLREQQPPVQRGRVGQRHDLGVRRLEAVLGGELHRLVDPAPGEQGVDQHADDVPLQRGVPAEPVGAAQGVPQQRLGLGQPAPAVQHHPAEEVGERLVAAAPPGQLDAPGALVGQPGRQVEAVVVGVGQPEQDRDLEAPGGVRPADAVDQPTVHEGVLGQGQGLGGVVAAHRQIPGADHLDRARPGLRGVLEAARRLGRELVGEFREPRGALGSVLRVAQEGPPHVVRGLQPDPAGARRGAADLVGGDLRGLGHPVAVAQGLAQPERGLLAALRVQPGGGAQRLAQVVDGGVRVGQQRRAAELEQDVGAVLLGRGLGQGTLQAAPGGLRRTHGHVLDGGLPQDDDHGRIVLGVGLQQVPGGGGRARAVRDQLGRRLAVQRGPHRGQQHALVDGGADGRVDELKHRTALGVHRLAQDPLLDQPLHGGALAGRVQRGHPPGDVRVDLGVQHGRRVGEAGGVRAELGQPLGDAVAPAGGDQSAQLADVLVDRGQAPVLHLGDQRDQIERAAAGDRPGLPAEHVVRVLAQLLADQVVGRDRAQRPQLHLDADLTLGPVLDGHRAVLQQRAGRVRQVLRPEGQGQQHRQSGEPADESAEPVQRLGVDPVQVVHDHHQRAPADRELGEQPVQRLVDALTLRLQQLTGTPRGVRDQPQRRCGDVVPGLQQLPVLVLAEPREQRLEQLPHHVERGLALLLTASGGEDQGAPDGGGTAQLGEHGGLPEPGRPAVQQQVAEVGAALREAVAEPAERRLGLLRRFRPLVERPSVEPAPVHTVIGHCSLPLASLRVPRLSTPMAAHIPFDVVSLDFRQQRDPLSPPTVPAASD